jgi:hypothetical protein
MFKIQFITDKEKLENLWFSKYHKKPEEKVFSETENFCREIETKWKEKEVIVLSLFKKITGLKLDGDFTVFVFHPKLEMAEYKDANTVYWGYGELYSNYIVVGITHELLHCLTNDFYIKLSDDEKWIFHALIYLSNDEELRFGLNGKDGYFTSPIIGTYHKKLTETTKNMLPYWKEYMNEKNSKNIIEFYEKVKRITK